jgi:uncharacterized membrane protein
LKNLRRRDEARERAEEYAPRPVDSSLAYGVVGVCLAGIGIFIFSDFYNLDPFAYPLLVASALLLVFGGSLVLRIIRDRRHKSAHRNEYEKAAGSYPRHDI